MRLTITDDDGTVLDSTDVTVDEWLDDQRRHPYSLINSLSIGSDPVLTALRNRLSKEN